MVKIGVHPHEREQPQPILTSLDMQVSETPDEAARALFRLRVTGGGAGAIRDAAAGAAGVV